jgi:hypothetical protein
VEGVLRARDEMPTAEQSRRRNMHQSEDKFAAIFMTSRHVMIM